MRTEVEVGASDAVVVEAVVEPLVLFALARRVELRVMRGMVF